MMAENSRSLHEQGWFLTETFGDEEFLQLAGSLGVPVPSRKTCPLIDELRPISKSQAQPCSLSAQYGICAFPLHTDTAHWRTPAHYVALRAVVVHDQCRPTLLMDSRSLQLDASDRCLLKRAVFAVRSGRSSFLTTIVPGDEKFFRFDRDCMFPKSPSAVQASSILASAERSCRATEIHWAPNHTLVLDNWRFLHGRSGGDGKDTDNRLLHRVLVADRR
jgi:alpha-ketoglutarate-dependent taurine dioxygenase